MHVMPTKSSFHTGGITLIEQLLVVAILAILACIALPHVGPSLSQHRRLSAQWSLISGLNAARELAITQGTRSIFCPTVNGQSCVDSANWSNGWLFGLDQNHDGQPDQGPVQSNLLHSGSLAITSSTGRHRVIFQPGGSASGSNITITLCDPRYPDSALAVTVANSGRVHGAQANAEQTSACVAGN